MRIAPRRDLALIFVCAALASSALPARASAYTDGNASYQSGNYTAALASYQQAATQDSGASKAKDLYKEGLTYHKLNQNGQAVTVYLQAQQTDPTLSFASSPSKFQQNLQTAQRDSASGLPAQTSGTVTTNTSTTNAAPSSDPAAVTLATQNVYVSPAIASRVDANQLQAASTANPQTTVKVAVLDRLPLNARGERASASLASGELVREYAKQLHDYLNLGQNGLVVVALHGNQAEAGVADVSDKLTGGQSKSLAQQYVSQIGSGNITTGTTGLMRSVAGQATTAATRPTHMLELIFLIVVIAIIILLVSASRRRKVEINTMRGPLEAQRESVLSGISYLDNYIDVLPKNNADSDQVRAFRQAAAYKVDQASKIIDRQNDGASLMQAQGLLQQANSDVSNARQYLDRATGGTGKIAGDDAVQPIPFPTNQQQVNQVPTGQRAVSFFSSAPAPVGALVPVTLNIDGQQRTVMATPQEAEQVRQGRIPPIRSFNVGGQNIPWYAYNQYDPYNDYYTYQNNGWRGVAGGAIAGFLGAEILGSLFSPRPYWGGGWNSPYAYGPGWDSWGGWGGYGWDGGGFGGGGLFGGGGYGGYDQGYVQGEEMAHAQDYNNMNDYGGGAGFFGGGNAGGGGSGGYDTSDYGGGAGFFGGGGGDRS